MIKEFNVIKEILEDTTHEQWHFELTLDDKEYQGYYKEGEVSWFQMQPDQENHEMNLKALDDEVRTRMTEWIANHQ